MREKAPKNGKTPNPIKPKIEKMQNGAENLAAFNICIILFK
ncbi:hypothetical protein ABVN80_05775 [Acinetobacter baumannii]